MRHFIQCFASVTIVLLITHTAMGQAAVTLDGEAVHASLLGNTVSFTTAAGGGVKGYLAPGGILRGSYDGEQFTGSWSIDDNKVCMDFPGDLYDGCSTVARYADGRLQFFNAAGEPAGYFQVIAGNADNF